MTLRFVEELTYEEIAAVVQAPVGTVKWRVFAAKEKILKSTKVAEVHHE